MFLTNVFETTVLLVIPKEAVFCVLDSLDLITTSCISMRLQMKRKVIHKPNVLITERMDIQVLYSLYEMLDRVKGVSESPSSLPVDRSADR